MDEHDVRGEANCGHDARLAWLGGEIKSLRITRVDIV
jgi:hypothetical protein